MAENPQTAKKTPRPPLNIEILREIQSRSRDDPDMRTLLWEIKRLQSQLVQAYNELGARSEFDAPFARDAARMVRRQLGREPAVAEDTSRRVQSRRDERLRAAHLPTGWAEFYGAHSFHGPPLPQSDGKGTRVKAKPDS